MRFFELLSAALGRQPRMNVMPMQPGDVQATYADIDAQQRDFGWRPTTIEQELPKLVDWYRKYCGG